MCSHDMIRVNDVKICRRCGLTICPNGQVFFDKELFRKRRSKKHEKNGRLS